MGKLTVNLLPILHKREIELGRKISYKEIAVATKCRWETIKNLFTGQTSRFDIHVLVSVCDFLNVPSGLIPFFHYQRDE